MQKEQLFDKLKEVLMHEFDLDESIITPDANIAMDLDLDSIDAVELIVKMKPYLTARIEPEAFKSAKTLADVVSILEPIAR